MYLINHERKIREISLSLRAYPKIICAYAATKREREREGERKREMEPHTGSKFRE